MHDGHVMEAFSVARVEIASALVASNMCNSSEPTTDSARQQASLSTSTTAIHPNETGSSGVSVTNTPATNTNQLALHARATDHTMNSSSSTTDTKSAPQRAPVVSAGRPSQSDLTAVGTGNNVVVPPKKSMQHSNIFRIGDFCYFETNTKAPYSIRKIEEITKVKDVPEPYVEVKAIIFKRRCEVPEQSLQQAQQEQAIEDLGPENTDLSTILDDDDHHANENETGADAPPTISSNSTGRTTRLRARQSRRFGRIELLQQRQLFNTRVTESLPAMYIRGKCYVDTLLQSGDIDRCDRYFEFSDTFYYSNCYDPDDHEVYKRKRGDIRVGSAYQTEVPSITTVKILSSGHATDADTETAADAGEADAVENKGSETTAEPMETDGTQNGGTKQQRAAGGGYALRQRGQKRTLLDAAGSVKRSDADQIKTDDEVDTFKQTIDFDQTDIAEDTKPSAVDSYDTLMWSPSRLPLELQHNSAATEARIKSFITATKAIGLYSRALELTGGISMRQPSVHITTALANRDMTTQYAYTMLHLANYDIGEALCALNSEENGLLVCRDQFEAWSSSEACLFEEGLARHGKSFSAIRKEFLPWKRVGQLVDYYYAWKTTDRYQQARRFKTSRAVQHMRQFSMHKVAVEDSKQPHRQQVTAQALAALGLNGSTGGTSGGGASSAHHDGAANMLKCFVCDKMLLDYYYHFGPALASTSTPTSAIGGGSGAAGATASVAAAAMYSSSTAAQMTRICYDCQLYWRRYACLRRPFINDQERKIVNDFVNLPHERSVQQAAAQALNNYQQNLNVSQNTAVQLTAQKLIAQQQQQQFGGGNDAAGGGGQPLSGAVPPHVVNSTATMLTRNTAALLQQNAPQMGTAAANLIQMAAAAVPGSAFGLGGGQQNSGASNSLQPTPFMHGKPPVIAGGGGVAGGVTANSNNPLRMSSSLSATAAAAAGNPSNPAALLIALHQQNQLQQQQQQQNLNKTVSEPLSAFAPASSSSSNFNGTSNNNLLLLDNKPLAAATPPHGNDQQQNIVAALRAVGAAPETASHIAALHNNNNTLMSTSSNGLTIKTELGEASETMESAAGPASQTSSSSSSAAAAQHRNNLRSRVSIFLLMTPASRAMRRLFEHRINIHSLARDPCNAILTSSASMPNLSDMRAVTADGYALARVLSGDGRRNRFRQRKSISDIIRSASVSDLPYPQWLVPSGNDGESAVAAMRGASLRFPPSEYKLIDPKQVVLEHMNLLSSHHNNAAGSSSGIGGGGSGSAGGGQFPDAAADHAAAPAAVNAVAAAAAAAAPFPTKSDISLTSSVATPSSSPSVAAAAAGAGLSGKQESSSKSGVSTNHHQHQPSRPGQLNRGGTTLEDFAWTTSRGLVARKYAEAAKLVGGSVAENWSGMEAAGVEQRGVVRSTLRKAGRNPTRNMGWPADSFNFDRK